MTCFHTKNYKGKALPTSPTPCLACMKTYFEAHPTEPVTGEALLKLIAAIEDRLHESLDDVEHKTIQRIVSQLCVQPSEWD